MKYKLSVNTLISALLLFCWPMANAQVQVSYYEKLKSRPNLGTLSMINDDSILTCGIPSTIEYLTCGANSTLLPSGECRVEPNETFAIDYKVNDVVNCYGTGGTSSWSGALQPFSGGSGTYSKTIPGGIDEQTTFTLNCVPEATTFNFINIAKSSLIDLNNMRNNAAIMSNNDKMAVYDMHDGTVDFIDHDFSDMRKQVGKRVSVMVRHLGTKLYFVPTADYKDVSIDYPDFDFDKKYNILLSAVSKQPSNWGTQIHIDESKNCHSLSMNGAYASINLSKEFPGEDCELDWTKPQYLLYYVLEREPQTNVVKQSEQSND